MLYDILNEVNESTPGKTAIQYGEMVCTYNELLDSVRLMQQQLNAMSASYCRVYLSGHNNIDLVVLFLALIELKNDVVLVDPKSTKKEIDELLVTLPASFLFFEEAVFTKDYPAEKIRVPYSKSYNCISTDHSSEKINIASVTFFSTGSTGLPKAFAFTEDKLKMQVLNLASHLGLNSGDKVLCPVSFTHSHGVQMSLPFLLLGATVHFLTPEHSNSPGIMNHIHQYGITVLTGVPLQYNHMLEQPANDNILKTLRYAFCGSAPMTEHLAINFEKEFGVRIHQAYGISEIGAICVNLFEEKVNNFQSVGKVIKNIEYKIVDVNDENVKRGDEGELLVRSSFMTDGYLNASSESLFRKGWMCTQDIVHEDDYGNIYIAGRKSNFINVSGYKVYPVEVERVLLSMPGVKDAIVSGEQHEHRTQSIRAYVSTFYPIEEKEIRLYCSRFLSKYKIPHEIIIMEELPVNSIGKVIASKLKKKE